MTHRVEMFWETLKLKKHGISSPLLPDIQDELIRVSQLSPEEVVRTGFLDNLHNAHFIDRLQDEYPELWRDLTRTYSAAKLLSTITDSVWAMVDVIRNRPDKVTSTRKSQGTDVTLTFIGTNLPRLNLSYELVSTRDPFWDFLNREEIKLLHKEAIHHASKHYADHDAHNRALTQCKMEELL